MAVPERRTLVVLGSLIGAMTLASGLLLMLEPRPVGPTSGVSLNAVEPAGRGADLLFTTTPPAEAAWWSAIVVHASGTAYGSAEAINRVHERLGRGGLGYHFVVNNGTCGEDGLIEVGFRWRYQFVGAFTGGPDSGWSNHRAIGICLVGDGERQSFTRAQMVELLWLVQRLQERFQIPADRVVVQLSDGPGAVGRLFPVAQFRQQLLRRIAS